LLVLEWELGPLDEDARYPDDEDDGLELEE
jgi:hypothetical protein